MKSSILFFDISCPNELIIDISISSLELSKNINSNSFSAGFG